MISTPGLASVRLGAPPEVRGLGVGVHGTRHRLERWLLPDLYCLHIYGYRAQLTVESITYELVPGSVSIIPAGAQMEYVFTGPSEHLYAHLRMPTAGPSHLVPIVQDLGLAAHTIGDQVRAATFLQDPVQRSAELWSVLWKVCTLPGAGGTARTELHPAVRDAVNYIESHLGGSLTAPEVAAITRFSPTHLDRLFRAAMGMSVSAFVRQRRMSEARHLLQQTTLSIASIAASVGVPDLQAFNKACRRSLGGSPRSVRQARSTAMTPSSPQPSPNTPRATAAPSNAIG